MGGYVAQTLKKEPKLELVPCMGCKPLSLGWEQGSGERIDGLKKRKLVAWLVGLSWLGIASSIPGQGTCLGCGFGPRWRRVQEALKQCFSLTSMTLPLFLFPFPSVYNQ